MPQKTKKETKAKQTKEVNITAGTILTVLVVAALLFLVVNYVKTPQTPTETTTLPQTPTQTPSADTIKVGDVVSLDYIGRFAKNNTIFDTSLADVALNAGIQNPQRVYEPTKATVGSGGLIPGFENALIGMKVGEEKTVTVPPEQAYGEIDEQMVINVNRTQKMPKLIPIPPQNFVDVFEAQPVVGKSYSTEESLWSLKVVDVANETVFAEQEVEVGMKLDGMFGVAEIVGITDDEILVRENPTLGAIVYSAYGPTKVVDYNDTHILVDLNHPLAGETLEFDITIRGKL